MQEKEEGRMWRLCNIVVVVSIIFLSIGAGPCSASHQWNPDYAAWAASLLTSTHAFDASNNTFAQSTQPYRTAFHFQPPKNWMNDPNGPLFYKGYYHLFYQWNPYAAVWGNITWGHAISPDLIHWQILEPALVPDQWYDQYGVWSGSVTIIGHNQPILMYTGWSNVSFSMDNQVEMQSIAVPEDPTDPLLRKWKKIPENPILLAPSDVNSTKFRDPTTAWKGHDGKWRMIIGARRKRRGLALLYRSSDFIRWEKAKHPLHTVPKTGMWECPDFYPIPKVGQHGLDTSVVGKDVFHVLKVSLDDTRHDHYAVGKYLESTDSFIPVNPALDAGIGLRYDYGKYYASKTFFDDNLGRRILIAWVNESSSNVSDVLKGWSSIQSFPRTVWLDDETKSSLLQWPIQEIEKLRLRSVQLDSLGLKENSIFQVKNIPGAQLDVEVEFELPDLQKAEFMDLNYNNAQETCSRIGEARTGVLGPFGLLTLASDDLVEQTAVFFYIVSTKTGWKALVCSDQSRSSVATDLDKTTYGSYVAITQKTKSLALRVLVDHSIVETFALRGKVCITSRVYPQKATHDAARLFLFNSGSVPVNVTQLTAWEMDSVRIDDLY